MPPLSVIVVDDEPLARERLRSLLEEERDVRIVGECASGRPAVRAIQDKHPDLVFLDVQMPGLDGFGVIQQLSDAGGRAPAIVFVTAYDQYALKAFEVHALDYLLKPFDRERFQATLTRAREAIRLRAGAPDPALTELLHSLTQRKYAERLIVKSAGKERLVALEAVDWFEAAGNYVRIHTSGERLLLRETMANLEERLDPARFARIHRSTIVNLCRVKELEPWFHGDYVVRMASGDKVTLSRGHRAKFLERLGR